MKFLVVACLFFNFSQSHDENQIEQINFNKLNNQFNITLKNDEVVQLKEEIKEDIFQIEVSNSIVWRIDKVINHPEMGKINAMALSI